MEVITQETSNHQTNGEQPKEQPRGPKRYKLVRKTQPVEIEFEDGQVRSYVLKELDGIQRDQYIANTQKRMKIRDGKFVGWKDFEGLQAELISRSLFDEEGKVVPKQMIQKWPSGTISGLFTDAQKLSGLDQDQIAAKAKTKND